ncbi:MAG TPA: hypothetical protein VF391_16180 [Dermatophilaceae bacterium]|jgi:HEAT repeat protein
MPGTPGQRPAPSPDRQPSIRDLLSGGNPRKLQNVDEVVSTVLAEPERLDELIGCIIDHGDEVVRMRAGDALEKVGRAEPSLLQPHVSLLLGEMSTIHQPSVQWHVAQMLGQVRLTAPQRRQAVRFLSKNLDESADWIVLNCSLDTMAVLARADPALVDPFRRQLRRHERSGYKSLANRARRLRLEFGPDPTAQT